jgi:hypothetical protein
VRLSVAHSGSYGGSRMTRGCATSYTAVRGTTTSSASVRPYGLKFFHGGCSISISITGKDTPTHRLTHILRPNATRPDPATRAALATPPTTDGDFSSHSPYDSDALPSSLSDVQSIDSGLDVLSESDYVSEPEFGSAHGRGAGGDQPHHPLHPMEITPLSDVTSDVDADVEVGSVQGTGDGGDGHFNLEQVTGAL